MEIPQELAKFAGKHRLTGLTGRSLRAIRDGRPGYNPERGKRFLEFQQRINRELLNHRVIRDNRYTAWFRQGEQSEAQIKDFVSQFAVFSNLFLVAQLYKMINADTLEAMRESKEILANEIGVVFRSERENTGGAKEPASALGPDHVGTGGSVEGGTFHFATAHFEWLYRLAQRLGLGFHEIGKRRYGSAATLFLRRVNPTLRPRELRDLPGCKLCRGKLGCSRVLAGADRRLCSLQPKAPHQSSPWFFPVAQPARSAARAPHARGAGGILLRKGSERRRLHPLRQRDAECRRDVLGRAGQRASEDRCRSLGICVVDVTALMGQRPRFGSRTKGTQDSEPASHRR